MGNGFERIIETGYAAKEGSRSKYVFTCLSCGQQITTQREYATGESSVFESEIKGKLHSSVVGVFYRIPVVGSFFGNMLSNFLSRRQAQKITAKREEGRRQAFEEVRTRFVQCVRCGNWACVMCVQNNMCRPCAMMVEATREMTMEGKEDLADPTKMWDEKKH